MSEPTAQPTNSDFERLLQSVIDGEVDDTRAREILTDARDAIHAKKTSLYRMESLRSRAERVFMYGSIEPEPNSLMASFL